MNIRRQAALLSLVLVSSQALGQQARLGPPVSEAVAPAPALPARLGAATPVSAPSQSEVSAPFVSTVSAASTSCGSTCDSRSNLFQCGAANCDMPLGNRNFPNFIGFISNPVQNIDPRSLTQIWPIFGSNWVSVFPPLSAGDLQVYGAGLNVALNERLSIGFNQGGYAISHFSQDRFLLPDQDREREGWLNLGGFIQYTLVADSCQQCLLTAGLRYEIPTGEAEVFQGHGPVHLAPYLTWGKEFGKAHILATGGYQFPTGPGTDSLHLWYGNVHLDYQLLPCFYPLIEFNCTHLNNSVDLNALSRHGFFDLGNFESTGNVVSMAPGFNLVLVRDRLELGAVYTRTISTQRDFSAEGLLVKMVMRY